MCGFLVVGSSELELQVFNDALNQAAYRGPDHQHVSINNGITWGFNRLSIRIVFLSAMVKFITIIA